MFHISYSCLPEFFFLIKKGKMGQPERIFTTVRINARPIQHHKLHFGAAFPHFSVALRVLYLEASQRQSPGDCPHFSCPVRTCFPSGGKRTDCDPTLVYSPF